jgi:hypothetical protein
MKVLKLPKKSVMAYVGSNGTTEEKYLGFLYFIALLANAWFHGYNGIGMIFGL